jgi:hypothetical protein
VIGHDVSEVLELIPAQLYVRRDKREKRACGTCEAAVVPRANCLEPPPGLGQSGSIDLRDRPTIADAVEQDRRALVIRQLHRSIQDTVLRWSRRGEDNAQLR